MTDLQVNLHDPEPAEKAPATVLGRPGVLVGDLDAGSGDHVDEMIEPASGRELPRRANESDEFVGRRLTSGGNRQFGDLVGVRLLARDGDRKTAFGERLRFTLGGEVRSNERRN